MLKENLRFLSAFLDLFQYRAPVSGSTFSGNPRLLKFIIKKRHEKRQPAIF